MAATIARATGYDTSRVKETHRLGSRFSRVEAATWETFARASVSADGSGYIEVERRGDKVSLHFGPETEPLHPISMKGV